jgi:hypothetical protein
MIDYAQLSNQELAKAVFLGSKELNELPFARRSAVSKRVMALHEEAEAEKQAAREAERAARRAAAKKKAPKKKPKK